MEKKVSRRDINLLWGAVHSLGDSHLRLGNKMVEALDKVYSIVSSDRDYALKEVDRVEENLNDLEEEVAENRRNKHEAIMQVYDVLNRLVSYVCQSKEDAPPRKMQKKQKKKGRRPLTRSLAAKKR